MELSRSQKRWIDKIIARMECEKDFECYKSEFDQLCTAKLVRKGKFRGDWGVECIKPEQEQCKFRTTFGERVFCSCPLRVYCAKNLGKGSHQAQDTRIKTQDSRHKTEDRSHGVI